MKNKQTFFAAISVLALIFGMTVAALSLTGCDNGGGGGDGGDPTSATYTGRDGDNKVYTLKITKAASNNNPGTGNSALNGTWIDADGEKWVLNNGNLTVSIDDVEGARGTYSTSGNTITVTITQVKGSMFEEYASEMGLSTSQWYTETLFRTTVRQALVNNGYSNPQAEAIITELLMEYGLFTPQTGTYSLSGATQTISISGYTYTKSGGSNPGGTAPAITTTTLPSGTVGTAYSQTLVAIGSSPITWSINSGSLPNGLTLSTTGVISGTPTAANTFSFTVKATNATGSNTKALSITITTGGNNPGTGTEVNPFTLSAGTWADGSITSTASDSAVWYSFTVVSGTTYYVWWNDADNSLGTLDVRVAAYYSNGNEIFDVDNSSSNSQSFIASSSGTVKIKVYPYSNGTGTFAVAYSTSSTRPGSSSSLSLVPTPANNSVTKAEAKELKQAVAKSVSRAAYALHIGGTSAAPTASLRSPDYSRAAYTPQDGDSYTLTSSGKTSKGMVVSISGATLTLESENNSVSFTVKTSGNNGITEINGTVTWTDNSTFHFDRLTLTTSGGNPGNTNVPSTSGRITINGLSSHNGKYIYGFGYKETDDGTALIACENMSVAGNNAIVTLGAISGGSATLKVWEAREDDENLYNFSKSGSYQFMAAILTRNNLTMTYDGNGEIDYTDMMNYIIEDMMSGQAAVGMGENVSFSGGRATWTFVDLMGGGYDWD